MTVENPTTKEGISAYLQKLGTDLRRLELIIAAGDVDPPILRDFRQAVDHARTAAWAVQQIIHLGAESEDGLGVFPLLVAERIRRTTELSKGLLSDLGGADMEHRPGIQRLFSAVRELYGLLVRLDEKSNPRSAN